MKTNIRVAAALLLLQLGTPALAQQSLAWTPLPGGAIDIGAGANGEVWKIGDDKYDNEYAIHRLEGGQWKKVPGGAVRIDVGPNGPWVVNSSGAIYKWTGSSWELVPGAAKDIGVGANGQVWVIGALPGSAGYSIHRWGGRGTWYNVPGSAERIDVDPQGQPWVVNNRNEIYRYDGSNWIQLPGKAIDIGIGSNGAVVKIGVDGAVEHWGGTSWVRKDGTLLTAITVSREGKAYGVNRGQTWAAGVALGAVDITPKTDPPAPMNWGKLPGTAVDIGVGLCSDTWIVDADKSGNDFGIRQLDRRTNLWTKVPGGAVRIDVGPAGPWVVNASGQIYRRLESRWDLVPGLAKDIGVGANGVAWVVGTIPEPGGYGIYRYNNTNKSPWDKIPGGAVRIDVDPDGNAWMVNANAGIFRFDGTRFQQLPFAALDIGIGANGVVFITGVDGKVYRWSGTNWILAEGTLSAISVDDSGRAVGVNPGGEIYSSWAQHGTPLECRRVPPPPERKGVTVKNESKSPVWVTAFNDGLREGNKGVACLVPGQETSFPNIMLGSMSTVPEYVVVRGERTRTAACESQPNNAHVTCDKRERWQRVGLVDGAILNNVVFTVRDSRDGSCEVVPPPKK